MGRSVGAGIIAASPAHLIVTKFFMSKPSVAVEFGGVIRSAYLFHFVSGPHQSSRRVSLRLDSTWLITAQVTFKLEQSGRGFRYLSVSGRKSLITTSCSEAFVERR